MIVNGDLFEHLPPALMCPQCTVLYLPDTHHHNYITNNVTIRRAPVRLSNSLHAPLKELTKCAKSHHDMRWCTTSTLHATYTTIKSEPTRSSKEDSVSACIYIHLPALRCRPIPRSKQECVMERDKDSRGRKQAQRDMRESCTLRCHTHHS